MTNHISVQLASRVRELLQSLVRPDGEIEVADGPDFESDDDVTTVTLHGIVGGHFESIREARRLLSPLANELGSFSISPRRAVRQTAK